MKKIGFVISGLSIGGNERSVSLLSKALSSNYEIFVIVFDGRNVAFDYDGELIDLKEPAKNGLINKAMVSFRRINKVRKIIKEKHIDILFTVTASINAISHYYFKGVKKIVSCRDCGDLERNIRLYAHMVKKADYMIFNSEHMRSFYLESYPSDAYKCFTVYNIVNVDAIRSKMDGDVPTDFLDFTKSHDSIITVGRFCREKGYNHLIRSFCHIKKSNPKAGLVIVGDGELRSEVRDMVESCVHKNDIYLTGAQRNPYRYIALCRIFALSSISEGFPNVLLEAMACGLPVIAVDCKSGPQEILTGEFDYHRKIRGYLAVDYGVISESFEQSDDYSSYIINNEEKSFAEAVLYLLNNNDACAKYSVLSKRRCEYFNAQKVLDSMKHIIGE
ncbi:MAG TPA: hypothetical protein DEB12_11070 [Porphyromonadaceae bacterium]|nr:hypothetical protein [Porphyromonadaceae bacterium]